MKKILFFEFILVLIIAFIILQNNNLVNLNFDNEIRIKSPKAEKLIFKTPNAFRYADGFYIFNYNKSDSDDIVKQLDHDDLKHLENQILICKRNYNSEYYHLFEENFPKEINNNLYYKIKTKRASNLIIVYDSSSSKLYYIGCYFKSNRYPINNGV